MIFVFVIYFLTIESVAGFAIGSVGRALGHGPSWTFAGWHAVLAVPCFAIATVFADQLGVISAVLVWIAGLAVFVTVPLHITILIVQLSFLISQKPLSSQASSFVKQASKSTVTT